MRVARMVRILGVSLVIVAVGASSVAAFRPDPDLPGDHLVGHTKMTIVDAARSNRPLPLEIWYPGNQIEWTANPTFTFTALFLNIGIDSTAAKDNISVESGQFPLVIFSHGFGSIATQSLKLVEHLASHGFVVVSINHTGNTQGDTSSPDPEADRYPDVAFTISEMGVLNATPSGLFTGRIDSQNVGVIGHSYGGMTAQFMAAGHDGLPPDPRVRAIVPVAASSSALTDAELQSITIPTLLLVGTLDGLQSETIRSFNLTSSAPNLFRVDVVGANHTHFANVCDIGNALLDAGIEIEEWPGIGAGALVPVYQSTCIPPAFPIGEATRIQNLYAAAHFRAYLYGQAHYYQFLTESHALANEPDVNFFGSGELPPVPALGWIARLVLGLGLAAVGGEGLRRRRA